MHPHDAEALQEAPICSNMTKQDPHGGNGVEDHD